MEKSFGWCFIGSGTLANIVAKQIVGSENHRIVSVYTRNPEKCSLFAEKWGAAAYASAEEAMTADGVDGVYIVTPHTTHFLYAKQAILLGKAVLCEKPFTVTAKEAEELIALAREKKVYIAEAMWTWFSPVANQVKTWLDEGEFGKLQKVVASYHMYSAGYAPRVTDPKVAGGALLDVGVYPITYLYRLFGNPVSVKCRGIVEKGIDWCEDIDMTFSGGETYTATASIRDFWGFERLVLKGEKAKTHILMFHGANRAKLVRKDGKNEVFSGDGSYLNEFNRAAEEIRQGLTESRYVPHQATLDVMRIMDECRAQMNLVYPFERG